MLNQLPQWFAVYTKPRWEKRVSHLLKKRGIECYYPLNKVKSQWLDRHKISEQPLLTSFIFVRISLEEQQFILDTDGVINFVYWLGEPAVIKDEEIEMMKAFMLEYENVQIEKINVNLHDAIRIIEGPFVSKGDEGVKVLDKTVKVFLPSVGYSLIATRTEKIHVEKVGKTISYLSSYLYGNVAN
jgi:transcription termination/antitermination protein NusG